MPIDFNTVSIIISVAFFFAGGGWWLASQFRDLKDHTIASLAQHKDEDNKRFSKIDLRLSKVEILIDAESR